MGVSRRGAYQSGISISIWWSFQIEIECQSESGGVRMDGLMERESVMITDPGIRESGTNPRSDDPC